MRRCERARETEARLRIISASVDFGFDMLSGRPRREVVFSTSIYQLFTVKCGGMCGGEEDEAFDM